MKRNFLAALLMFGATAFAQDRPALRVVVEGVGSDAVNCGIRKGDVVAVWGAGPVGQFVVRSCFLFGAEQVIVIDHYPRRLAMASQTGAITINFDEEDVGDRLMEITGGVGPDACIDAVGLEAHGHGREAGKEQPATVLNSLMQITRAGGAIGIPGLYVTDDPGGVDEAAKTGNLSLRIGLGWAKSHVFSTGQCPVMRYHRQLMQAILHDKIQIAKAVNATLISLDEAPQGYRDFDKGAAKKFVIDPHRMVAAA